MVKKRRFIARIGRQFFPADELSWLKDSIELDIREAITIEHLD